MMFNNCNLSIIQLQEVVQLPMVLILEGISLIITFKLARVKVIIEEVIRILGIILTIISRTVACMVVVTTSAVAVVDTPTEVASTIIIVITLNRINMTKAKVEPTVQITTKIQIMGGSPEVGITRGITEVGEIIINVNRVKISHPGKVINKITRQISNMQI